MILKKETGRMRIALLIYKNSEATSPDDQFKIITSELLENGSFEKLPQLSDDYPLSDSDIQEEVEGLWQWYCDIINSIDYFINKDNYGNGIHVNIFNITCEKDYWGEYDEDYDLVEEFIPTKFAGEWWKQS